ncbi:MAG TPA: response regulator [Pyrinomonadaceae bacterium]|nr:response regulator [Pyrinomonadaceae bacterium]
MTRQPPWFRGSAVIPLRNFYISGTCSTRSFDTVQTGGGWAGILANHNSLANRWPVSSYTKLTSAGGYLSYKTNRKTVLVVEDVDEISSQMGEMLRRKGHRILNAANAEEAIRIAENKRPAMILTDLDLPTFDTLVRSVRAHKDLNTMLVAIIDINDPDLREQDDLKVISNFDQLDELLASAKR